jgi:hypothetical protein
MQTWAIQNQGFNGGVKLRSQRARTFYEYSLWHEPTGEHLFDGAAGDLAEAVDSLLAHINFLTTTQSGALAASNSTS